MNDSLYSRSWNIGFLRQSPYWLSWWLLKMLPYCLNISTCSDSNVPSTVTFIFIYYTSSVPKFLENLFYRLPAWSLSPRNFPAKYSLGYDRWFCWKVTLQNFWPFVHWKLDCNIYLGVKQLLQVLFAVSLKIKSQLLFSLKLLAKKNRDSFVGHSVAKLAVKIKLLSLI